MVTQVRDNCSGRNVSGFSYDMINKRMGVALYYTCFDVFVMVMEKIISIKKKCTVKLLSSVSAA
jgi:hypothetical protein